MEISWTNSPPGFSLKNEEIFIEPIAVEKSHIGGNYQYFVKLIRRLGTKQGNI